MPTCDVCGHENISISFHCELCLYDECEACHGAAGLPTPATAVLPRALRATGSAAFEPSKRSKPSSSSSNNSNSSAKAAGGTASYLPHLLVTIAVLAGVTAADVLGLMRVTEAIFGREPQRMASIPASRCKPYENFSSDVLWPPNTPPGTTYKLAWPHPDWVSNGTTDSHGRRYPFTAEQLFRSFTPPDEASRCAWQRVSQRLAAGEHAKICIAGGSMTLGAFVSRGWPTFLVDWAPGALGNVTFVNLAIAGTDASRLARYACPRWPTCDAYLVDTGVNADDYNGVIPKTLEGEALLLSCILQKGPAPGVAPAVLFLVSIDIATPDWPPKCYGNPITTVVTSNKYTHFHFMKYCMWLWQKSTLESEVASALGLPIMSYRTAVWPVFDNPPPDLMWYWSNGAHPNLLGHELYSDMAKFALLQLLKADCSHVPSCASAPPRNYTQETARWFIAKDALQPTCAMRRAGAASVEPITRPVSFSGNWQYMADKPKRAVGWVGRFDNSSALENLTITFPVVFSASARLELTVLRSYENFLDADVTMSNCETLADQHEEDAVPAVRGSWKDRLSIPDSTAWDANGQPRKHHSGGYIERRLACLPEVGVTHNVTISVIHPSRAQSPRPLQPNDKVKILAIDAC